MKQAVIIFTRVPVPGHTKTRLMPFLSGEDCAGLHREMIRRVYQACRGADGDILVFFTPEDSGGSLRGLLKEAKGFFPQKGEGLGERMSRAFVQAFRLGYERVLLIGTDLLQISAEILQEGFRDLSGHDAVMNPTEDGGYYLIGLKEARDDIWDVPSYGTGTVFRDTLCRMEKAGLRVAVGQRLMDIDTPEDLVVWYGTDRCIRCGACTENCLFLQKYGINLAELSERPELAYSCFLCGRCKAVCPEEIDGGRIAVLMRQMRADRSGASYKGLLWEKNPYKFAAYGKGRKKSVLFPGCNFPSFYPKTTGYLERLMKDHGIGTVYDCCQKPVYELGLRAEAEENLEQMAARLKSRGVEELILLCPNCYHFLKGRLDIPMTTVYRKLKELGEGQMFRNERIPVYVPCPDREEKEMFGELGIYLEGKVEEPFYHVQCCGLGGCAGVREPELAQRMADTAKEQGGTLYTYCASCVSSFRRKGMKEVCHLLPLILGIEEKVPLGIQPFLNRAGKKLW